ncbi:MobD [Acinetobacter junii CIP 107470 = MTCC 11364]|uniref:MobD n=1 Tax=Acinetobacter junii CIP 107470 = MTCC 11364 TaxID=1217666 RepID=S7WMJ4_ACIJU|nr:hypothetical protein [Acinetobacter junii]ENV52053.1 hypothetical protein F953_00543 [Acinetobacter junii CIP 107470 = MTCC 11364]EPR83077.1 MobD [Acinetobacter junii CIP 107470 = MTCC 11364]
MSKNIVKKIFQVNGGKGGVGKSFVSMALIDYFRQKNEAVLLVETDTSNPDVYKIYHQIIDSVLIDLDSADGWIDLVNTCEKFPDHIVIINTAARNHKGMEQYGSLLTGTLNELKRELVTYWVINRQRDSVELLKNFTKIVPEHRIHVFMNEYFGSQEKFELYNSSELKKNLESNDGKSIIFPEIADRVSDEIYSKRIAIENAATSMPIGNRAELNRWRQLIKNTFDDLI